MCVNVCGVVLVVAAAFNAVCPCQPQLFYHLKHQSDTNNPIARNVYTHVFGTVNSGRFYVFLARGLCT